jgi:hypothetical protein
LSLLLTLCSAGYILSELYRIYPLVKESMEELQKFAFLKKDYSVNPQED